MDWQELNAQLDQEFACDCADGEVRYLICANGAKQWKRQCPRCGQCGNPLPRLTLTVTQMTHAPAVDPALREHWWKRRRERQEELSAAVRAEQAEEYAAYLESEWWRSRRALRLEFDAHRCQARFPGCADRASQVHHWNYTLAPPYREPLFALASVCRNCHEWLHGLRDGGS